MTEYWQRHNHADVVEARQRDERADPEATALRAWIVDQPGVGLDRVVTARREDGGVDLFVTNYSHVNLVPNGSWVVVTQQHYIPTSLDWFRDELFHEIFEEVPPEAAGVTRKRRDNDDQKERP